MLNVDQLKTITVEYGSMWINGLWEEFNEIFFYQNFNLHNGYNLLKSTENPQNITHFPTAAVQISA